MFLEPGLNQEHEVNIVPNSKNGKIYFFIKGVVLVNTHVYKNGCKDTTIFLIIKSPGKPVAEHPDIHGISWDHIILKTQKSGIKMVEHKKDSCSFHLEV